MCHGPRPAGGRPRAPRPTGPSASRSTTAPAPIAHGRNDRARRRGPISPSRRIAARASATAAPRWLVATWPAAMAAAMAPIANRLLRPTSGTVTRSLSCANVFSPTSLRVRRSSTVANGCSSRDAMILAAVTGPIPGSASSSAGGRAVQVDRRPGPAARTGPRTPRGPVASPGCWIVPRWHTDLVAVVQRRGQVQVTCRATGVDSRAVAAGGSNQVADPRPVGRRKTPGRSTAPTISTTSTRSLPGRGGAASARARQISVFRCPGVKGDSAVDRDRPARAAAERQEERGNREKAPRRRKGRTRGIAGRDGGAARPVPRAGFAGSSSTRHGVGLVSRGPLGGMVGRPRVPLGEAVSPPWGLPRRGETCFSLWGAPLSTAYPRLF